MPKIGMPPGMPPIQTNTPEKQPSLPAVEKSERKVTPIEAASSEYGAENPDEARERLLQQREKDLQDLAGARGRLQQGFGEPDWTQRISQQAQKEKPADISATQAIAKEDAGTPQQQKKKWWKIWEK